MHKKASAKKSTLFSTTVSQISYNTEILAQAWCNSSLQSTKLMLVANKPSSICCNSCIAVSKTWNCLRRNSNWHKQIRHELYPYFCRNNNKTVYSTTKIGSQNKTLLHNAQSISVVTNVHTWPPVTATVNYVSWDWNVTKAKPKWAFNYKSLNKLEVLDGWLDMFIGWLAGKFSLNWLDRLEV